MARERTIERKLKSLIENVCGACEKHVGAVRGDPDRVCSFPNGYHCLVETKWEEGVEPEPHQLRRHEFWRNRGIDVWVVGSNEHIIKLVNFALFQPPRLSVGSCDVPGGQATRHVGGRPWTGKDGYFALSAGHAEINRIELLPGAGARTKARR